MKDQWNKIVDDCAYTVCAIEHDFNLSPSQLRHWLSGKIKPQAKTILKIEEIMQKISKDKKIEYSPVWGYATPEQIKTLQGYVTEEERARIMKQIEKQTKLQGKVK